MNPNHPLYNALSGMQPAQQPQAQVPVQQGIPNIGQMNPVQKTQYMMQAMRNPAAFVRQALPQVPAEAFNDPTGNSVLQYMMSNMGVTQQDVQNAMNQMPGNGQFPKF